MLRWTIRIAGILHKSCALVPITSGMRNITVPIRLILPAALIALILPKPAAEAQLKVSEQTRITWHSESELSGFSRGAGPAPVTVATPESVENETYLPLDEAIQRALRHSEVIRVLTGVSASSSGRTIYDTAIATTAIDQAIGRFDPVFSANSSFRRTERPFAFDSNPGLPVDVAIGDRGVGGADLSASLAQTNRMGGTANLGLVDNLNRNRYAVDPLLNPSHSPALELSYTQPLLSGFGRSANEAPIVIARLQLDQSYFQFKSSVQELVRGTIAAYWALVQARTELWAREKQVEQSKQAYDRAEAQLRIEITNLGEFSQTRVAFANFRANRIAAAANVLQREAALRNLLGLPPEDGTRLVPSTPPTRDQVQFRWEEIVGTAQVRRPDLIELNLILMADQQRLVQGRNQAQPALNAVGLHRWNGLSGRLANGSTLTSSFDDHTDWTMGVTFEVPLGLRRARAQMRSQELIISRDRANIQQSLHLIEHQLATSVRSIDQNFLQYEAFRDARDAATNNLARQLGAYNNGKLIFLILLQAISDYGNSIAAEAQALTSYNTELASLELQTGTILETHGITFVEEQFASIGPWGRHFEPGCYPRDLKPNDNAARYEDSKRPSEEAFDLKDFSERNPDLRPKQQEQNPQGIPPAEDKPDLPEPAQSLLQKPGNRELQPYEGVTGSGVPATSRSVFRGTPLKQLFE